MSGGNVAGGVIAGLVLTLLVALATELAWLGRALLLLALVALVVLLVPRWRRAGAGFVMGLALGGIVFGGVCGGMGLLQQSPYGQDQRKYEQAPLPDASGP
ncbi:hypothetical protein [Ornithinimicrobium cerasi]|uniref:Uncharacterized protein n=1 Tax=Ornithinimicrobium cerasi TaxID=2248773 RepID=A0A285VAU1_9MICO|nr:hypothetical protein [Ornithinimicrobium cerasi]SOC51123.1 hypothetical protein SAMN05421879_10136 [Ornithinimicrobium cerasi]